MQPDYDRNLMEENLLAIAWLIKLHPIKDRFAHPKQHICCIGGMYMQWPQFKSWYYMYLYSGNVARACGEGE